MVWKGIILNGSLENDFILDLVKIVKIKGDKYYIEVEEVKKDEFIQKAIKSIKQGFYLYIVKEKIMYVIFKDKMFKFSRGYPELETARSYGKSVGIPAEQMPFEYLIDHPFN